MPQPSLTWRDGAIPVSNQFDDPYFSLENGLEETRHVFLHGNDLPARFQPEIHVAELGFGTGLNFLATLQLWRQSGQKGKLHFTSFEAYPMAEADFTRALAPFESMLPTDILVENGLAHPMISGEDFVLTVVIGDARTELANWQGAADAWFLDGFSPAKNPELWEEPLMAAVARHTKPGGTFATYTAAGFVRRGLAAAGFTVERVPGFGRKRHMTRGVLR